jgi:outer membrane protein insertion porin family
MSLSSDFGVGVRIVTPIGPIRLDYAIGKDGGRTQFSIGQSF